MHDIESEDMYQVEIGSDSTGQHYRLNRCRYIGWLDVHCIRSQSRNTSSDGGIKFLVWFRLLLFIFWGAVGRSTKFFLIKLRLDPWTQEFIYFYFYLKVDFTKLVEWIDQSVFWIWAGLTNFSEPWKKPRWPLHWLPMAIKSTST